MAPTGNGATAYRELRPMRPASAAAGGIFGVVFLFAMLLGRAAARIPYGNTATPIPTPHYIYTYTSVPNVDSPGYDIGGPTTDGYEACQARCDALPECLAYTMGSGFCWVKSALGFPVSNPDRFTIQKLGWTPTFDFAARHFTYLVYAGKDYPGHDIHPSAGPTNPGVCGIPEAYNEDAAACERRCDAADWDSGDHNLPICYGFVHTADNNCCYLKGSGAGSTNLGGQPRAPLGLVDNPRTSFHSFFGWYEKANGLDYPFNDIMPPAGAPTNIGACNDRATQEPVEACTARCDAYGQGCVGVVYVAENQCCYLKSALANETPLRKAVALRKRPCAPTDRVVNSCNRLPFSNGTGTISGPTA